jgi:hypothetical protein
MTEYSRLAKGSFMATGTSAIVVLPFQPDFVEIWNYSNIKTLADSTVTRAWWDNKLADGANNPTMIEGYNSSGVVIFDQITNISSNLGINAFSGGIALQYGAAQAITTLTKSASPTVVTTTGNHGYQVGDTVIMYGIALNTTNNMQLLNNVPFTITAIGSPTTFSVKWDSSGSAYTTVSPTAAFVKKVLYPFLYVPQDNVVTAVTTGTTTTIATSMYHNFEPGQEIAFRMPTLWGTVQLNSLPDVLIPGSPIYGYVTSVTDNWTFVCNINSSSFTAFTNNFTMASNGSTLVGLTFAQVVAVGDVNTGGLGIYTSGANGFLSNSPLYPSPNFPTSTNRVPTINGPAVKGAFVNNTSQGFTIGSGLGAVITASTGTIVANTNIIYWQAKLHDFANP